MCEDGNPGNEPLPAPDVEINPQRDFATLRERLGINAEDISWNSLTGRATQRDGFPVTIERPPRQA